MTRKKVYSLSDYNAAVLNAERLLSEARKNKDEENFPRLKEELRVAKENLRIFKYRAKPCITQNGHSLRH